MAKDPGTGVSENYTIDFPQYVWVDLGPAQPSGPTVSISNAPAVEDGTPGSPGTAKFTVTLDHASTTNLTFNVIINPANTIMPDTAQVVGDIGTYPTSVTIPAGATTATLQVPLVGDTQIEPKEQFVA